MTRSEERDGAERRTPARRAYVPVVRVLGTFVRVGPQWCRCNFGRLVQRFPSRLLVGETANPQRCWGTTSSPWCDGLARPLLSRSKTHIRCKLSALGWGGSRRRFSRGAHR